MPLSEGYLLFSVEFLATTLPLFCLEKNIRAETLLGLSVTRRLKASTLPTHRVPNHLFVKVKPSWKTVPSQKDPSQIKTPRDC